MGRAVAAVCASAGWTWSGPRACRTRRPFRCSPPSWTSSSRSHPPALVSSRARHAASSRAEPWPHACRLVLAQPVHHRLPASLRHTACACAPPAHAGNDGAASPSAEPAKAEPSRAAPDSAAVREVDDAPQPSSSPAAAATSAEPEPGPSSPGPMSAEEVAAGRRWGVRVMAVSGVSPEVRSRGCAVGGPSL
jgi:hypothetical protein